MRGCGVDFVCTKHSQSEKSNTTGTEECNGPEYLMCSMQQADFFSVYVTVVYEPPHVICVSGGILVIKQSGIIQMHIC